MTTTAGEGIHIIDQQWRTCISVFLVYNTSDEAHSLIKQHSSHHTLIRKYTLTTKGSHNKKQSSQVLENDHY